MALGGQERQGRLLYIWERWLLSLMDGDIEAGDPLPDVRVPESNLQSFVASVGMSPDLWFAGVLLGLARISPRIAASLDTVARRAPEADSSSSGDQEPPQDLLGEEGSLQR